MIQRHCLLQDHWLSNSTQILTTSEKNEFLPRTLRHSSLEIIWDTAFNMHERSFVLVLTLQELRNYCHALYVYCPSLSAHRKGCPTGPEGGAFKGRNIGPSPAGTIGPASCTLVHTNAFYAFGYQLYPGQLRVLSLIHI